jgi:hypothetical protein
MLHMFIIMLCVLSLTWVFLFLCMFCSVYSDNCVLCVCKCVMYCCHRASTQLQLNISYIQYIKFSNNFLLTDCCQHYKFVMLFVFDCRESSWCNIRWSNTTNEIYGHAARAGEMHAGFYSDNRRGLNHLECLSVRVDRRMNIKVDVG